MTVLSVKKMLQYNFIMLDEYIHFASIQPKKIQVKNLESSYNNKNFFELIDYIRIFFQIYIGCTQNIINN